MGSKRVTSNLMHFSVFLSLCRLAVSDCAPQTSRVSSNMHSSSSMSVSRVPSPPPPEVNTPVAENWCYTQVRFMDYCPLVFHDRSHIIIVNDLTVTTSNENRSKYILPFTSCSRANKGSYLRENIPIKIVSTFYTIIYRITHRLGN